MTTPDDTDDDFCDDTDDGCFDSEGAPASPIPRRRQSILYTRGLEHGRLQGLSDLATGGALDLTALDAMCSDYHTGYCQGYYGVFALEVLTAPPPRHP